MTLQQEDTNLKDITEEYKEERRNIRTTNLIIITGRCYKNKDQYYELLETTFSKNPNTDEWFDSITYKSVLDKVKYVIESQDFYNNFQHVKDQLK